MFKNNPEAVYDHLKKNLSTGDVVKLRNGQTAKIAFYHKHPNGYKIKIGFAGVHRNPTIAFAYESYDGHVYTYYGNYIYGKDNDLDPSLDIVKIKKKGFLGKLIDKMKG